MSHKYDSQDTTNRDDSPGADPIPVVLATDIGSDVDDTWALAQLLRTPELDLQMILTETGEAQYRAEVAAKTVERAGRTDVPIALGVDLGPMNDEDRHQGPWVEDYDLAAYPGRVCEDGIDAVVDLVRTASGPITIVSIAPTPSLAAALERDPHLAEHCRFVGMHGSFYRGYEEGSDPDSETNVRVDPDALRTVLSAPWRDIVLTPLDTCGRLVLEGVNYHRIWCSTDDPLARAVIENTCIFATRVPWMTYDDFTRRSSTLFDSVAVYLAHDESLLEIETFRFEITDDGYTVPDPDGPFEARIALEWTDLDAFEDYLTDVLLG